MSKKLEIIRTIDSDDEIEYGENAEVSEPEESEGEQVEDFDEEDEMEEDVVLDLREFERGDDEDDGSEAFKSVFKRRKVEDEIEEDEESDTDIIKKDGDALLQMNEIEEENDADSESEGEETPAEAKANRLKEEFQKKQKQVQKKKNKKEEDEIDNTFEFDLSEDQNPWDYSSAKAAFGKSKVDSVDSKINKILNQKKRFPDLNEVKEEPTSDQEDEEEGSSGEESGEAAEDVEEAPKKIKKETKIKKEEDSDEEPEIVKDFYKRVDEGADEEEELQWESLSLSKPVMRAIKSLNYRAPTPIQSKGIPVAMAGGDIVGSAATGSGKTAAFVVPIIEKLLRNRGKGGIRALIILPSRELALQCHAVIEKLSQFTDLQSVAVVGGLSVQSQEVSLKQKPDIVVCTPGRMIDHLRNTASVGLENLKFLVLDEADRLLDMGFKEELEELVKMCPKGRQTQLYSATMTEQVDKLIRLSLKNPVRIAVSDKLNVAEKLTQEFVKIRPGMELHRDSILLAICKRSVKSHAVIFVTKKITAHRLKIVFGLSGLKASELHGNLSQTQRLESLEDFRDGRTHFLIATDLAARGLDIQGIQTVINFEMPRNMVEYVHRVGRTARAGGEGRSISFAGDEDKPLLKRIIRKAREKVKQRIVPDEEVERAQELIAAMEADIKQIIKEEKFDKVMEKADMEASKAQNLIDHESEIKSRPARTWFLTEKEKKENAKKVKKEFQGEEEKEDEDETGQTRSEEKASKKRKRPDDKKPQQKKKSRKEVRREKFGATGSAVANMSKKRLLEEGKPDRIKTQKELQKRNAQRAASSVFEKEISSGSFKKSAPSAERKPKKKTGKAKFHKRGRK